MSSSVVAAAVLWVAVAVRLPTVTRGAAQRYLFVALTALAVGLTLDIPQIAARLPELTGAGPNLPHMAKNLLVVLAAGAVREVVRASHSPQPRRRRTEPDGLSQPSAPSAH